MECLKPITLNDKKMNVPCGRCVNCLQRKRSQWSIRMQEELKVAENATFLTLTYGDEYLPRISVLSKEKLKFKMDMRKKDPVVQYLNNMWKMDHDKLEELINDINEIKPEKLKSLFKTIPTLKKSDLQKYFKRVRKVSPNLKYFAVGEYGSKGNRPHYHAIVFNADKLVLLNKWSVYDKKTKKSSPIGRVSCDSVSPASIHYVSKYLVNNDSRPRTVTKPFQVSSKGLGINYLVCASDYHKRNLDSNYTTQGGQKLSLPRYYSEKIFNEKQKEALKIKNDYIRSLKEEEKLNEDPKKKDQRIFLAKRIASQNGKSNNC